MTTGKNSCRQPANIVDVDQAQGLFYLHPQPEAKIADACVAMLRVTGSFKAEHYDKLVHARSIRLKSEFQAKLGWQLGNLYGRAAAPDWSDQPGGSVKLREIIDDHLRELVQGCGPTWIPEDLVPAAKGLADELTNRSSDEILARLEAHRPTPPIDIALAEVGATIQKVFGDGATEDQVKKVCNRLRNNGSFTRAVVKASA